MSKTYFSFPKKLTKKNMINKEKVRSKASDHKNERLKNVRAVEIT